MDSSEIPKLAHFEAHVLHRAASEGYLDPYVRSVEDEYALDRGSLGNGVFYQTRVPALLYCLIVVPKEAWSLKKGHDIYAKISASWSVDDVYIQLDTGRWQDPVYGFIHHLRNAIAHAHFEFKDPNAFEFWDQEKDTETYRARLSLEAMERFLEVVGRLMAYHDESPGVS